MFCNRRHVLPAVVAQCAAVTLLVAACADVPTASHDPTATAAGRAPSLSLGLKPFTSGDSAVLVVGPDGKTYRRWPSVATGGMTAMSGEMCTDLPPTPDGCPLMYSSPEHEMDMATPSNFAAVATDPLWNGENMQYSQNPRECPPYVVDPEFKVYIPEDGETVTIQGAGHWQRVAHLGFSVQGHPMAAYAAPAGYQHYSSRPIGRYIAEGGQLRGRCGTVRVRPPGGGVAVYVGPILWYDYTGNVFRNPGSGGGRSPGRGWAYEVSGTGYRNGDGSGTDWGPIVDQYIEYGTCTEGWEIWIDGDQVCDAAGNRV